MNKTSGQDRYEAGIQTTIVVLTVGLLVVLGLLSSGVW